MNVDKIIAHYVALRDRKDALKEKHKAELAPINEDMEKIEGAMKKLLQEQGVTSQKGEHGTVFLQEEVGATVTDWPDVLDYIQRNERWDLLERRVSKTAVTSSEEEVPGVKVTRRLVTRVRRA